MSSVALSAFSAVAVDVVAVVDDVLFAVATVTTVVFHIVTYYCCSNKSVLIKLFRQMLAFHPSSILLSL